MNNTPNKHFFKVKIGYKPHEYIIADELEVEKAYFVFLFDGKTIINGRPLKGSQILDILPHYGKHLGFNDDYVFGSDPDDRNHAEREGVLKHYQGVQGLIQKRVTYLVENNQQQMLGKGVDIPQLSAPAGKPIEGLAALTEKMSYGKK